MGVRQSYLADCEVSFMTIGLQQMEWTQTNGNWNRLKKYIIPNEHMPKIYDRFPLLSNGVPKPNGPRTLCMDAVRVRSQASQCCIARRPMASDRHLVSKVPLSMM